MMSLISKFHLLIPSDPQARAITWIKGDANGNSKVQRNDCALTNCYECEAVFNAFCVDNIF